MITPMVSIASLRRLGLRAGAWCVPLVAAGVLAAGCGAPHGGVASQGSPSAGATGSPSAGATGSAAPSAPATPVPTVSGGPVTAGEPACAGWPVNAPTASLPVSFVPVSVERCVDSAQVITGKGVWSTATLERADSGLAALVAALRQSPAAHTPDTVCPAVAVTPQQIVLIGKTGQMLIPRLPVTGCALSRSGVLAALDGLPWQPVSVRLIAKIPGAGTAPRASGSAPHSATGTAKPQ